MSSYGWEAAQYGSYNERSAGDQRRIIGVDHQYNSRLHITATHAGTDVIRVVRVHDGGARYDWSAITTFKPKANRRNRITSSMTNSTACTTSEVTGIQTTIDEAMSPAKPPINPACIAFRILTSLAN